MKNDTLKPISPRDRVLMHIVDVVLEQMKNLHVYVAAVKTHSTHVTPDVHRTPHINAALWLIRMSPFHIGSTSLWAPDKY